MFESSGLLQYYRAKFQVSVYRITGPHLVAVRQDSTGKPVLSDHIKQDLFVSFRTGGWLSSHSFLLYFHAAISNHLSIAIFSSPEPKAQR